MGLPQPEPVGASGGEIADVQHSPGEISDLRFLPFGEESIRNAALIEDLESACVKAARA